MRGWTTSKVMFVVVVALLIVAGAVGFVLAGDDGGRVDFWNTEVSVGPEQPLGFVHASAIEPKATGSVNSWRTRLSARSPQQLAPTRAGASYFWKRTVVVRIDGGNSGDRSVVRAWLSCTWRYDGYEHMNTPDCDTWGDGDSHWLWHYEGVSDWVRGGGMTSNCGNGHCEYRYRRPYFLWERGYQDISQRANAWISLTMRADGSCKADKYHADGVVGCDSGGSW